MSIIDRLEALLQNASQGHHIAGQGSVSSDLRMVAEFARTEDAELYALMRRALPALLALVRAVQAERDTAVALEGGGDAAFLSWTRALKNVPAALKTLEDLL